MIFHVETQWMAAKSCKQQSKGNMKKEEKLRKQKAASLVPPTLQKIYNDNARAVLEPPRVWFDSSTCNLCGDEVFYLKENPFYALDSKDFTNSNFHLCKTMDKTVSGTLQKMLRLIVEQQKQTDYRMRQYASTSAMGR
jgi:hypothetical protein